MQTATEIDLEIFEVVGVIRQRHGHNGAATLPVDHSTVLHQLRLGHEASQRPSHVPVERAEGFCRNLLILGYHWPFDESVEATTLHQQLGPRAVVLGLDELHHIVI